MLAALQQQFLAALNDDQSREGFFQQITLNQKRSCNESFDIYRASIAETLARALRETYPVCERLVGEVFFKGMAYSFIRSHPCYQQSLFNYGGKFPDFIREFKPTEALIYLGDVAELEWAYNQTYYAKDQADIRFLLSFNYPIYRIWQVNQPDYRGDQTVELKTVSEQLLVQRYRMQVKILKV